jgi:hypothetical protein
MRRHAQEILERWLVRAMVSPDPAAIIARGARDRRLPLEVRRRLRAADPDGVRLSALLVARLRFERLLNGSAAAGAWFESDPAAFSAAFRRYHAEVPLTAFFPAGEAAAFEQWASG